jgi:hypothetical protein
MPVDAGRSVAACGLACGSLWRKMGASDAGCVMVKSSCIAMRIEGFAGLEHGPDDGNAASGEGDDGPGVVFSLAALSVLEGAGG